MSLQSATWKNRVFLGLSAATGGLIAVLSDIMQKHEASAVEQLQITLGTIFGGQTYLWVAALLLIALAVALSFIFGADNNKAAFTTGAGILAFMVTLTPYKPLPNLDTAPAPNETTINHVGWWDRLVIPSRVFAQAPTPSSPATPYTVHLEASDGKPITAAIFTLVDARSGQAIRRSRVQGGDLRFYVSNQSYLLRVQVDGYQIAEARLDPPPHAVKVSLTPSSIPLSIQRLFQR